MANSKQVEVPALDHDAMMAAKFGSHVSPNGKLERRIVANLIAHLERAGFKVHSVNDGEELKAVTDMKAAMEAVFAVDEASLRFYKGGKKGRTATQLDNDLWHGVMLMLGEGVDIINDWNYNDGDADGFNKAMEAFNAEDFA